MSAAHTPCDDMREANKEMAASLLAIADLIGEAVNTKIRTGRLPNVAPLLDTIECEARAALAAAGVES